MKDYIETLKEQTEKWDKDTEKDCEDWDNEVKENARKWDGD
jgi:hypothetical protein